MSNYKYALSICLGLASCGMAAYAQNATTVKGQVVDQFGEPLIGANIRIVGTRFGTVADPDGNFELRNVPANSKIEVGYLGYISQTITNYDKMDRIVLEEDSKDLNEVVVVGYGTQKQKNVTGSVESINAEELKDLSVTNLGEALSGMINGLHVSMNGHKPGDAAHLTIRQSSQLAKDWGSINAKFSSQDDTPLYIIDDFISSESAFNNLDPSEVESISILKDASAAIYGAQGAYGVVLVKTKRGQIGAPKISYTGQIGVTDRLFEPKMMNSYDYARTYNAYMGTATDTQDETRMKQYFQADEMEAMRRLHFDPLNDEWSAAVTQRHGVNIDGGNDRATYFAGISYNTQDGNLGRLDYERWNYRAGVNANITKFLKATLQLSGNYGETKTPRNRYGNTDSGDYNLLLHHLPFVPSTVDGLPIIYTGMENVKKQSYGDADYNFYAIQNSPDYNQNRSNGFNMNTALELDFGFWKPLTGLKAKVSYSKSISNSQNNQIATTMDVYRLINRGGSAGHLYVGEGVDYSYDNLDVITLDNGNLLSRSMSRSDSYQMNFILTYARKFGLHNVSGLFSIEKGEAWAEDVAATGVNPLAFTDGQSNSAQADTSGDATDASWGRSESGRLSYIGRFNYSYADRYLLEFLIRSDASTKFHPDNYWGTFPSISAGWVMSEEKWFDKEKTHIDFFKIRASWGLLGRDNINSYVWMTRYNRDLSKGAIFGTNSVSTGVNAGMTIEQGGANRDAHWDKTYKTNLGVDLRFLDSRLSVNADFYYDRGREIFSTHLGTKYYPTTVGIQAVPENFAELDAWGTEINVGWRDKIGNDFSYWVKMSTGYTDNEVKKIAEIANPDRDDQVVGMRKDHGLWGYSCVGMFRSYQQIDEYFEKYGIVEYMGKQKSAVHPGMLIYQDICGPWDPAARRYDPTPDGIVDENDMVQLSKRSDNPYGVTFNFGARWKSLSFSAQLGASWGSYSIVPSTVRKSSDAMTDETGNIPAFWKDMFVYEDVLDAQGNVIAASNINATIPNFRYADVNNVESTYWRIDGTNVSLRNISVAYELPKDWIKKAGISSCRVNLTCQNAINFVSPSFKDAWSSWGGSYGYYPNLRKFSLGLNVSF